MIKIEFKEAIELQLTYFKCNYYEYGKRMVGEWYRGSEIIESITFGCPSELVPSREDVLKQLGITKERDDAMQEKYSIEHVKPTDL